MWGLFEEYVEGLLGEGEVGTRLGEVEEIRTGEGGG